MITGGTTIPPCQETSTSLHDQLLAAYPGLAAAGVEATGYPLVSIPKNITSRSEPPSRRRELGLSELYELPREPSFDCWTYNF